jgi:uncharacterized protein YllA (UPF0747 family)
MSRVKVELVGIEWVGTCDHDAEVWTIHRTTKHNAWRSLLAHIKHEHRAHPDTMIGKR